MQPQNVFLQTFIRNLITNCIRDCDSFFKTDIWRVTSCTIDWLMEILKLAMNIIIFQWTFVTETTLYPWIIFVLLSQHNIFPFWSVIVHFNTFVRQLAKFVQRTNNLWHHHGRHIDATIDVHYIYYIFIGSYNPGARFTDNVIRFYHMIYAMTRVMMC